MKGLLAQRKARELFHGLLKSGTKTCYIQDTISNNYKHTTSNFLNPYGNAQGCENRMSTQHSHTSLHVRIPRLGITEHFFSAEEDRKAESDRRWSEKEEVFPKLNNIEKILLFLFKT